MPERLPQLCVIITAGEQRERAERLLASVLAQSAIDRMEIILIDAAAHLPPLAGSDHPAVRVSRAGAGATFGGTRAEAIKRTEAPIIAFLEDHVEVLPGWAEAVIAAHEGPWAGVGFEMHNANRGIGISNAVAVMNYLPYLAPARPGVVAWIPAHNASFKRDVLLGLGGELPMLLLAEIALQWRIQAAGHQLYLEPAARVAHLMETNLWRALEGYFLVNRALGAVRPCAMGWPAWKRIARVLLAPINPWVRLAKLLAESARQRPDLLPDAVRGIPALLAILHAIIAGQTVGLIFGAGDAPARFLVYETTSVRQFQPTDRPAS